MRGVERRQSRPLSNVARDSRVRWSRHQSETMRSTFYKISGVVVLVIANLTIASASHKYKLNASSIVPATTGEIEVKKDKNGNTALDVKVKHLAKPENLTPPQTTYMVWIQKPGGDPENQGQLKVNNKLEGEFKSVTPYKSFQMFVTGETNPNITAPSGPEVLRGQITP
jgi:hypothetical protein